MKNEIYFLVNMKRCGWCRKFKPVMDSNIKAMNETAQSQIHIADSSTPEGAAIHKQLGWNGGVPCTAAVHDGKILQAQPGYMDNQKLAPLLFQFFNI